MTTLLILGIVFVVAVVALVLLLSDAPEQERSTSLSESARADEITRLVADELAQTTTSRLYASARMNSNASPVV